MIMAAESGTRSRVRVIIPAYNAGEYIEWAVHSVLDQTFKDCVIIVIDDGSTDDTKERLAPYSTQIRYVYQENQERSVARNHGIRCAQGDYIAFLDADDYWLPDKLARQVPLLV
jgi:glycosyltransferase involved in cell wall biosynthesis